MSQGNLKVRAVARLLYREMGARTLPTVTKGIMPTVTVADANFKSGISIKKDQRWMYPNGVIKRHPQLRINGKEYYDPKALPEKLPRRKHESNLFITINTNRTMRIGNTGATGALQETLRIISDEAVLAKYLVFGPKDPTYADDRYEDIVDRVQFQAGIETGDHYERLHAHIWLTIHHYSQVQINSRALQSIVLEEYNSRAPSDMRINGKPYVAVKLLPQSDFVEIMKNYMHKAVLAGPPVA